MPDIFDTIEADPATPPPAAAAPDIFDQIAPEPTPAPRMPVLESAPAPSPAAPAADIFDQIAPVPAEDPAAVVRPELAPIVNRVEERERHEIEQVLDDEIAARYRMNPKAVPGLMERLAGAGGEMMAGIAQTAGEAIRFGLENQFTPLQDIARGQVPQILPGANFQAHRGKTAASRMMADLTSGATEYWNPVEQGELEKFAGGVASSMVTSIPAMVGGVPGLLALSASQFGPAFDAAIRGGASPEKAYIHAAISTGAEFASEYLGGVASKSARILGHLPFLPAPLRKYLGQAERGALQEALKEAGHSITRTFLGGAAAEGLEEVASTLAQRVSAAVLYDPSQITNVRDLLTDAMMSFFGGAAAGGAFTPLARKAARDQIAYQVEKGIVDQWKSALEGAKEEGAYRPEDQVDSRKPDGAPPKLGAIDEDKIVAANRARWRMEAGARMGNQELLDDGRDQLAKLVGQEMANTTEREVVAAAKAFSAMESPDTAKEMLDEAVRQFGPESSQVRRIQKLVDHSELLQSAFETAFAKDIRRGAAPDPLLGGLRTRGTRLERAEAKLPGIREQDWDTIARQEGLDPAKVVWREERGYIGPDGKATLSPVSPDGSKNTETEGFYQDGKLYLFKGSIRGDIAETVGLRSRGRRQRQHLRLILREEFAHSLNATPEGKANLRGFLGSMTPTAKLRLFEALKHLSENEGYSGDVGKLTDEYLAKLYRRDNLVHRIVDAFRVKLHEWFPQLTGPISNETAGRVLMRALATEARQTGLGAALARSDSFESRRVAELRRQVAEAEAKVEQAKQEAEAARAEAEAAKKAPPAPEPKAETKAPPAETPAPVPATPPPVSATIPPEPAIPPPPAAPDPRIATAEKEAADAKQREADAAARAKSAEEAAAKAQSEAAAAKKTADDAAKAQADRDARIAKLEADAAKLRGDLEAAKKESEEARRTPWRPGEPVPDRMKQGAVNAVAKLNQFRAELDQAGWKQGMDPVPPEILTLLEKWKAKARLARQVADSFFAVARQNGIPNPEEITGAPPVLPWELINPPPNTGGLATGDFGDGAVFGSPTIVYGTNFRELNAIYAWVRDDAVHSSHQGDEFEADPDYAPLFNTRDYFKDKEERTKVLMNAKKWSPNLAVTTAASAAEGLPVLIPSPKFDQSGNPTDTTIFRVGGGNGRVQAMRKLTPEQIAEHHRYENEHAADFGLGPAPGENWHIYRLLDWMPMNSEGATAEAQVLVDVLNPQAGQAQSAEVLAKADGLKARTEGWLDELLDVSPTGFARDVRDWLTRQIRLGRIDRNTRIGFIAESAKGTLDVYIKNLYAAAAFGENDAAISLVAGKAVSSTATDLAVLGAKFAIRSRTKGMPDLADAVGEMLQRVMEQTTANSLNLRTQLDTIHRQTELTDTQPFRIARIMAGILSGEVVTGERVRSNGEKERVVQYAETVKGFKTRFDEWDAKAKSISQDGPDIFGNTPLAPIDQFEAYIRNQRKLLVPEVSDGPAFSRKGRGGVPLVREWKTLNRKRTEAGLTQSEVRRMARVEVELGQSFIDFFGPEEGVVIEHERDERRLRAEKNRPADPAPNAPAPIDELRLFEPYEPWSMGPDGFLEPPSMREGAQWDLDFGGTTSGGRPPLQPKRKIQHPTVPIEGPESKRTKQPELELTKPKPKRATAQVQAQVITTRPELLPPRPNSIDWEKHPNAKHLAPHQQEGVDRILHAWDNPDRQKRDFGLFDGTGAGKTRQELAVAKEALTRYADGPVLIVTEKDSIITDAFAKEAEVLGLKLYRYKGQALPPEGSIAISTYYDLTNGLVEPGKFKTVIYDEAHNLRGEAQDSEKAKVGRKISEKANRVLFATATPLDKPEQLWYLQSLLGESPMSALARVGIKVDFQWVNGEFMAIFSDTGHHVDVASELDGIFSRAYAAGRVIKREVPLNNLEVSVANVRLSPEELDNVKRVMDEAEEYINSRTTDSRRRKGFILMRGREALELYKLRVAAHKISLAVRAGRSVVVYGYRAADSNWSNASLLALASILENEFGAANVGRLFGGGSTATERAYIEQTVARFQANELKIIIATPAMASTGISLDDVIGDAAREIFMLSAPFSSLETAQIAGRIARLTTKGQAYMTYLLTNHKVDRWNFEISIRKLMRLGAVVKGDIFKLEPDTPESEDLSPESVQRRSLQLKGLAAGYSLSATPRSTREPKVRWNLTASGSAATKRLPAGRPDVWMEANLRSVPRQILPAAKLPEGSSIRSRILRATYLGESVNLTGFTANTPEDIATVGQLLRNPAFEVFRMILTKGGRVVSVYSTSSRTPDVVTIYSELRDMKVVERLIRETGADGVWYMHNHPSGSPKPSDADIAITQATRAYPWGGIFKGHVVINHGTYALINQSGAHALLDLPNAGPDPRIGGPELLAATPEQLAAFNASGDLLVARLGKTLERGTDHITVLILDTQNASRAVIEIPAGLAKHEIRHAVRTAVQLHGGATAHAFYTGPLLSLRDSLKSMTATVFATVQVWDHQGGDLPVVQTGSGRRALTSEGENVYEQQAFEETEARIDRPESVTVAFSRKRSIAEDIAADYFQAIGQAPTAQEYHEFIDRHAGDPDPLFSRKPRVRAFAVLEEGTRKFSDWRHWYRDEKAHIDEMFGDDAPLFTRFLAATSANATVLANVSLALKAFRQHIAGEPFTGFLVDVIHNLERARRGEDLVGAKIDPFDRALAGDESAIAIDRHVMEAIFGPGVNPTPARIEKAKDVVRKIAAKHGWTPREAQAALWAWNIARRGDTPRRYREAIVESPRATARPGDAGSIREGETPGLGLPGGAGGIEGLGVNEGRRQKDKAQLELDFERAVAGLGKDPVQAEFGSSSAPQGKTGGVSGVGSVVASEIAKGFKRGAVNPIGMTAKTPGDLHAIAGLFRNPAFETFRYVFIKGGKVTGAANISARSPNTTAMFAKNVDWAELQALAKGADSYFITHNHPSGDSTPSPQDIVATHRFFTMARLNGEPFSKLKFRGHIVTNHSKHHIIDHDGNVDPVTVASGADPILTPLWGEVIDTPEAFVKAALALSAPNPVFTAIVVSTRAKVRAVLSINPAGDPQETKEWILAVSKELGGTFVHGYLFSDNPQAIALANKLVSDAVLRDVVRPDAGGLLIRSGSYVPLHTEGIPKGEVIASAKDTPMFSRKTPADHPPLEPDLLAFRARFPTSPEIQVDDSGKGPEGQGAYYDPASKRIVVVPTWMPRSRSRRRGELLAALHEAGVSVITESFWRQHWDELMRTAPAGLNRIARQLAASGVIANPEKLSPSDRQAILREVIRRSARLPGFMGPVRTLMVGLGASTSSARVVASMQRALRRATDQFEIATPAQFTPQEQAQVYADQHAAVWAIRDSIFALDEAARVESEKALEDALFKTIRDRMRTLAEAGEAASIGTGHRVRFSPGEPSFLFDLRVHGIAVSEADVRMHQTYIAEMDARSIVNLAESLDRNRETYHYLRRNLPEYDASALALRIRRQESSLDSAEQHRPDAFERAMQIRYRLAAMPEAQGAHAALADPRIQEWIEIIRRIEESGVVPRAESDMPPGLREASRMAAAIFSFEAAEANRSIQEQHDAESDRILREVNALLQERRDQRAKSGEVDVGILELLSAIAGDERASGSFFSREVAEEVRARHQAIARLAQALGRAEPTTLVGQFRDALVAGDVPRLARSIADAVTIRELAAASGISTGVTEEILGLIGRNQELRNAIVFLADEADARSEADLLNAVQMIEAARRLANLSNIGAINTQAGILKARHAAFAVAMPILNRLRGQSAALRRSLAGITQQLSALSVAAHATHYVQGVAAAAAASASAIPNTIGLAEMVYRSSNGEYLAPFTRADGSTQPSVRISPTREYSREIIERIMEWRDQAIAAVAAGSNPPHITRGLEVGQALVVTMIDAHAVSGAIGKTMAPTIMSDAWGRWPTSIRAALSRLVPGIMGRRLADAFFRYARIGKRLDAIMDRHHNRRMDRWRAAYDSYGLNPLDAMHRVIFERAYSEAAHLFRSFGSRTGVGTTLFTTRMMGLQISPELLSLLRYDREIFREAQAAVETEEYGGIRNTLPGGVRLIRPPAPTGDIGFARLPDRRMEQELADTFTILEEESRRTTPAGPVNLTDFWETHFEAPLSHILDSDRPDLAFPRDPILVRLEQAYAAEIRSGAVPPPTNLQDIYNALIRLAGTTIASPATTIPAHFLAEMDRYARIARSRVSERRAAETAITGAGTFIGESDINEFTSPAAPLIYPSGWYHYGAENDLRDAIERINDRAQVSMLDALRSASKALSESAARIEQGIGAIAQEDLDLIRWHTPHWISGDDIDPGRMAAAVSAIKARASIISAEVAKLTNTGAAGGGIISQVVRGLYPPLLAWPRAMLTNTVGGPVSSLFVFAPIIGNFRATLTMAAMTVGSGLNMAWDLVSGAGRMAGLEIPGSTRTESIEWLETLGLGASYSHAELLQMQGSMMGPGVRKTLVRGLLRVGDVVERTAGRGFGTARGDTLLNRFAAQVVVPMALWRMKRLALRWQARVAATGAVPGLTTDPALTFGDHDSPNAARLREMLEEAGLNPEVFLNQLANDEIDIRRFWRHPAGAMFGEATVDDFNSASRTNRPHPNTLLGLLGWTSATVSRALDLFRTPAETGRVRRYLAASSAGLSIGLTFMVSAYAQAIARRFFNEGQSALAQKLADVLSAPPGDDDDELTWWNWLRNAFARVASALEVNASPTLLPFEAGWWNRPIEDILLELAKSPFAGIGLDRMVDGGSIKVPTLGLLVQILGAGGSAVRGAINAATGNRVEAVIDFKQAMRDASSAFGEWGRILYNIVSPNRRQSTHDIRAAANRLGIPYKIPQQAGGGLAFTQLTPVRGPLLEAAVRVTQARGPEARAAAEANVRAIGQSIYQRAYDRTLDRGGFANEVEARTEADKAGRNAVQASLSAIEPVTRALGRSVTQGEFRKLTDAGALDTADVKLEKTALGAATRILSSTPSALGSPLARMTAAVLSPVKDSGAPAAGPKVSGGSAVSGGRRRRTGGRIRIRSSRPKKFRVPRSKRIRLARPTDRERRPRAHPQGHPPPQPQSFQPRA